MYGECIAVRFSSMLLPGGSRPPTNCSGTNLNEHGIAYLLFRKITRPRAHFRLCSILGTARRQDSGAMGHFSIAETGQFSQAPKPYLPL